MTHHILRPLAARHFGAATAAVLLLTFTAACTPLPLNSSTPEPDGVDESAENLSETSVTPVDLDFDERRVRLGDGRIVTCLIFDAIGTRSATLSCDWEHVETPGSTDQTESEAR